MILTLRIVSAAVFLVVFGLFLGIFAPAASLADDEEYRTVNRVIPGNAASYGLIPAKPAHNEYIPLISNYEKRHQNTPAHAVYSEQDWEPDQWKAPWTAEFAIRKFFQMRIFERQYMRYGQVPVVELGPVFYKLSDLDQRRTLKLLTDQAAVFEHGYGVVELVDWSTHDLVGSYTQSGLSLN